MNNSTTQTSLRIILVRAGSTELDDQGRISGSLDMPLSETGNREAQQTAVELAPLGIDIIYSSRCLAAQQTAEQLSNGGAIRVRVKEPWTNLDHGLWHGKSIEELKETQPKLYRQWNENPESICPPGGETIESVRNRISASLNKLRRKRKTGTVCIVAPEPLYGIFRSLILSTELRDLLEDKSESDRWEVLDTAAVV